MTDEIVLRPCPLCNKPGAIWRKMAHCSNDECFLFYTRIPVNEWQQRPTEDRLRAEITADDQRLRDAATRAGVMYAGCDTADALADEIIRLRNELMRMSSAVNICTNIIFQVKVDPDSEIPPSERELDAEYLDITLDLILEICHSVLPTKNVKCLSIKEINTARIALIQ
jgi:hypothetical protein